MTLSGKALSDLKLLNSRCIKFNILIGKNSIVMRCCFQHDFRGISQSSEFPNQQCGLERVNEDEKSIHPEDTSKVPTECTYLISAS